MVCYTWRGNGGERRYMARQCSICAHPNRSGIEALMLENVSNRELSRRYDVSKDSLSRHRRNHMAEVLERHEEEYSAKLVERMESLQERTELILAAAEMHDHRLALAAVREVRHNCRLLAELSERREISERIAVLEAEL